MSTMKERMHTGELYLPGDDEIMEGQLKRLDRLYDFNSTRPTEILQRGSCREPLPCAAPGERTRQRILF